MDVEIRSAGREELDDVVRALEASWGHHAGEEDLEDARTLAELDRTFAAFEAGRPVAAAAALTFELTLPGGVTVPVGGLTEVGVLPTHRRRGLLRALMGRHVEDSRARGEAALVLVASEGTIYGRFGYGVAALAMAVEIDPRRAAFAVPPASGGDLRLLSPEEMALLLPEVYERYRLGQAGEVSRSDAFWKVLLRDRERWRDGASARFAVAHEQPDGDVDGYATYRMAAAWPQGLPDFKLQVEEVVSPSPEVRAALWQYLLSVDLVGTVSAWSVPVGDPLRWRLADPRALRATSVRDMLWLRVVEVAPALAARRYPVAGRLVLHVGGEGRYVLEGGPEGAACRPAPGASPDLSLGLADLAAVYLGGVPPTALARAGRIVEQAPGALARADSLFASDPPPHCVTDF